MALPRSIISKIHVAKSQLGMDDEAYRALLQRVCGVTSSKTLNKVQADKLLAELERLGFQPLPTTAKQHPGHGKPHNFDAASMPVMITKIEAQLTDMQLPWSYADAIANRMFHIERCAWVRKPDQLRAIIAALDVEQEKRCLLDRAQHLAKQLGYESADVVEGIKELPKDWQRKRAVLKPLVQVLEAAVAEREGAR
jgi:phage gp16-like protein